MIVNGRGKKCVLYVITASYSIISFQRLLSKNTYTQVPKYTRTYIQVLTRLSRARSLLSIDRIVTFRIHGDKSRTVGRKSYKLFDRALTGKYVLRRYVRVG